MSKPVLPCPNCGTPLVFREWSKRWGKQSLWREALADCKTPGCGKWAVRYFDGKQTCEPYQVKPPAKKTKRGSWKLEPCREAAIIAVYGSVQIYLDTGILVGMPLQVKP